MIIFQIAWQTFFVQVRNKILHSALIFSVLFVFFSFILASLTFIESKKILLDFGLSAISLSGIAISFYLSMQVVGKEIENRTIYTILSKPISRNEYLLGKFMGGAIILALLHMLNSITLLLILQYAGESVPMGFFACIYLMILESILLLAIGLFFSLITSSLILASSLSIAVFLIGRSSYSMQLLAKDSSSIIGKAIKFLYYVFPSLDRFNIRELIAYAKPYPEGMIQMSSLYFLAYTVFILFASLWFFQRKDLA